MERLHLSWMEYGLSLIHISKEALDNLHGILQYAYEYWKHNVDSQNYVSNIRMRTVIYRANYLMLLLPSYINVGMFPIEFREKEK